MREVKFRAFDKDKKVMYRVRNILWINQHISSVMLENGEGLKRLDQIILIQYTGLKDKKGVEIYEDDVLFHPLQGRRRVFYPYSENVASYGLRDIDNGFGSTLQNSHAVWEVIGNIHENPELLED